MAKRSLQLNELISRNARLAFEAHQKREAGVGRDFTRAKLITVMWQIMAFEGTETYSRNRIRKALDSYFPRGREAPERFWRCDYLEAFCVAVQVEVTDIVSDDFYGDGVVQLAKRQSLLAHQIEKRMTESQLSALARELDRILQYPGLWDELEQWVPIVLDAADKFEAAGRMSNLIMGLSYWEARGKKKASDRKLITKKELTRRK